MSISAVCLTLCYSRWMVICSIYLPHIHLEKNPRLFITLKNWVVHYLEKQQQNNSGQFITRKPISYCALSLLHLSRVSGITQLLGWVADTHTHTHTRARMHTSTHTHTQRVKCTPSKHGYECSRNWVLLLVRTAVVL